MSKNDIRITIDDVPHIIQKNSNWCWAASLQMIFNYHEDETTQENIVKQGSNFGNQDLANEPANEFKIDKYLEGVRMSWF